MNLNKSRLNKLTIEFNKAGIMTNSMSKNFQEYIAKNSNIRFFDVLKFCNKALVFDLKKLPKNSKLAYSIIFNKIRKVIPDLEITKFDIVIKKTGLVQNIDKNVIFDIGMFIEINSEIYKSLYSIVIPQINLKNQEVVAYQINRSSFVSCINKYLSDYNSNFRIYYISEKFHFKIEEFDLGLILMNKKQSEVLSKFFSISRESHNSIGVKKLRKAINDFKEIGLLKHISINELNEAIHRLERYNFIDDYCLILLELRKILFEFPEEVHANNGGYKKIIEELELFCRDDFNPINIKEDINIKKKHVNLSYELGSKTYKIRLNINGYRIDWRFEKFLKESISDAQIGGQIYDSVDFFCIYLTLKQRRFLVKNYQGVFGNKGNGQQMMFLPF